MMSANLDLVHSIYAAHEHGDFSSAEWADPEIEYLIVGGPAPGHWRGLAGIAEGCRDFLGAWEEYSAVVEEYRELDGERILVLLQASGRGKTSGLDIGQLRTKGAAVFQVRDGKVTRYAVYWDRDRAFADLALAGEDDAP